MRLKLMVLILAIPICSFGQGGLEVNFKPTEAFLLNFEGQIGKYTEKTGFGILASYRPSTQNSGDSGAGAGLAGYYGNPIQNRLYTGITACIFLRKYYVKNNRYFLGLDLLYRNWSFDKKYVVHDNVEGYSFEGIRSDNQNVICAKLLWGARVFSKKQKRLRLFLDVYLGIGFRKQYVQYETFNGTVNDVQYDYLKETRYNSWITPQFGFNLGFIYTSQQTPSYSR